MEENLEEMICQGCKNKVHYALLDLYEATEYQLCANCLYLLLNRSLSKAYCYSL